MRSSQHIRSTDFCNESRDNGDSTQIRRKTRFIADICSGSTILQNTYFSFKYIGSKISMSKSLTAEIDTRLNVTAAAYAKLNQPSRESPNSSQKNWITWAYYFCFIFSTFSKWNLECFESGRCAFKFFSISIITSISSVSLLSIYPTLASSIYVAVMV